MTTAPPKDAAGSSRDAIQRNLTVNVRDVPVTVATTESGGEGGDLVLLLHGLGCVRQSFDAVRPASGHERWVALDFPGHGQSPHVIGVGDLLGFYSDLVLAVVKAFDYRTVHLVAHSMGGAVGLLQAERIARLGAVILIEGNLRREDCGLVSRRIASQTPAEFTGSGYAELLAELHNAPQPDLRTWGGWMRQCDPATLHQAAVSLVEWSDSGALAVGWHALRRCTYLWGERSGFPAHLADLLTPGRSHQIPGAGHLPMLDNPHALAAALRDGIGRGRANRS